MSNFLTIGSWLTLHNFRSSYAVYYRVFKFHRCLFLYALLTNVENRSIESYDSDGSLSMLILEAPSDWMSSVRKKWACLIYLNFEWFNEWLVLCANLLDHTNDWNCLIDTRWVLHWFSIKPLQWCSSLFEETFISQLLCLLMIELCSCYQQHARTLEVLSVNELILIYSWFSF